MGTALQAFMAQTPLEHLAAEGLFQQVLTHELGTHLAHASSLAISEESAYCQHILVQTEQGRTIASARLRTQALAEMANGYHSEQHFAFAGMASRLEGNILELDQLCTHKAYRQGPALNAVWSAVTQVVAEYHIDHLLLLVPLVTTQLTAAFVMHHIVPQHLRITPIIPLGLGGANCRIPSALSLLLDLGAQFCGEPAWDENGGCAHALLLLNTQQAPTPMLYQHRH